MEVPQKLVYIWCAVCHMFTALFSNPQGQHHFIIGFLSEVNISANQNLIGNMYDIIVSHNQS